MACTLEDCCFEANNEFFEVFGLQFVVKLHTTLLFDSFDNGLEGVNFCFIGWLETHNHITIHLYETTIGIVCETRIARLASESLNHFIVQTEVENRIHHTWHRSACTAAHTEQERIGGITKLAVHEILDVAHTCFYLLAQKFYHLVFSYLVVLITNISGNGKTRRHGNSDVVHFCEIGALATKQLTHVCTSFGLAFAESVDSFGTFHNCNYVFIDLFFA